MLAGGHIVLIVLSCSQWCLSLLFSVPCSDRVSPCVFFSFLSHKICMSVGGELGSGEHSLRALSARHVLLHST